MNTSQVIAAHTIVKDNPAPPPGSRVVVAMSGGVDSAVVALMLREQGYDIVGVNLRVWEYDATCNPKKKSCCSPEDIQDARAVGLQIDIPFYVLRMEKIFQEKVIDRFIKDYSQGRTPNPCVECNTFVKFGALFDKARDLGIETIATGHYAGISQLANGQYTIRAGKDEKKNQAYYLYGLSQEVLSRTYFPLANMTKPEVREIARKYGLVVADKEESQEICFVPNNDYRTFLEQKGVSFTSGYFKDEEGNILGEHRGRERFTVGQRKGLGIAWKEPLYVLRLEKNGDVILGPIERTNCPEFYVHQLYFMGLAAHELTNQPITGRVQIRYRSTPTRCQFSLTETEGRIKVTMLEPVSSVTPGQSAVFFPDSDTEQWVMMGGIIER